MDMKPFLIKLLWFLSPLIIVIGFITMILRFTGENYLSVDRVIKSSETEKYLIGYSYNEKNYGYLKWKSISEQGKKDIWALGSSRVLQFREEMFESQFYNSGNTISSIADFLPFLESLPKEKYPSTMIIGLDQWMLNKNWDDLRSVKSKSYWENSFSYLPSSKIYFSILKNIITGKYDLSLIAKRHDKNNGPRKVGLNASINNSGFRNDGSFSYGIQAERLLRNDPAAYDYNYSDTYNRIEKGNNRFQYGDKANLDALLKLEEFLKFCSDHDIKVVGLLPPFATKVYDRMIESGRYNYLNNLYPGAKERFDKFNFELWDLTNLEKYNSGDDETVDGFHGGELAYLKMLTYMVNHNSILKNHTDSIRINNDIQKAKNKLAAYDD